MSIFRKGESRTVSVAFELAAWATLGLVGLTIYALIQMWVQL